MKYVTLSNGVQMPIVGSGTNTYAKLGNDFRGPLTEEAVEVQQALQIGYRMFDCAVVYRNEHVIGQMLAQSDMPRTELFITTKIPADEAYVYEKEATASAIDTCLRNFQTDYIDLLLIHFPIIDEEQLKRTWEVFETYYKLGRVKAIGVSNFDIHHLEQLQQFAKIQPMVNQIQINLQQKNEALLHYCKAQQIVPIAWGPMKASAEQYAVLDEIGEAYNKTGAQVLLKYQIQRGIVVIPKSHQQINQRANFELFDFTLHANDINRIEQL